MARKINTNLHTKVTANTRDFSSKMQNARRDVNSMGKSTKKLASTFQTLAAGGAIGAAVAGFASVTKEINRQIIAADQLNKKVKVVFGQYETVVAQAAEKTANNLGLSQDEFREAAAGIQDLLIPLGFMRGEATDMSLELVKLSGALSEWTNGQLSATEVSKILAKAVLGENDQLKQLGISIRKDTGEYRDLVKQIMETKGASKLQAEALAEVKLIMEKSSDAQKAFANNQDSIARKTASANARLKDQQDLLITKVTPAWSGFLDVLIGFLDPVTNGKGFFEQTIFSGFEAPVREIAKQSETAAEAWERTASAAEKFGRNINKLAIPDALFISRFGNTAKQKENSLRAAQLASTAPGVAEGNGFNLLSGTGSLGFDNLANMSLEPIEGQFESLADAVSNSTTTMQDSIRKFGVDFQQILMQSGIGIQTFQNIFSGNVEGFRDSMKEIARMALIPQIIAAVPFPFNMVVAGGAGAMIDKLFGSGSSSTGVSGAATQGLNNSGGFGSPDVGHAMYQIHGDTLTTFINEQVLRQGRYSGGG